MKLRTPFTVISNPARDIDQMQDLSCKTLRQPQDDFCEQECELDSTTPTFKPHEV